MRYHITDNPEVAEYQQDMVSWIEENSQYSRSQIEELFTEHETQLNKIFYPDPETIFHDDPAKWAELLAINWGIMEEELEFI